MTVPEEQATKADVPAALAEALGRVSGQIGAGDVFGPATEVGDRVVITASAIERGGGFGFGSGGSVSGDGGSGGGGGGSAAGRPVAAIEIGPEGVTIHPIVDVTRVGIAALASLLALFGGRRRLKA